MTNVEFSEIRRRIGLTQSQLATLLGYSSPLQISSFERATNPRQVPTLLALLMKAYDDGYRPNDWPENE